MNFSQRAEKDLRRQIDRAVSRALVDDEYARMMLSDPTIILEQRGCSPQQYKCLRSMSGTNLVEFARQARRLFWAVEHERQPFDNQQTFAENEQSLALMAR